MTHSESRLLLFNIAKKANFGNLIRTANAFGVSEVIVVGKREYHEFGAFGTTRTTARRHFYTLDNACEYLRTLSSTVCGIEICEQAMPVQSHPFRGPTTFMVGNEGDGLSDRQRAKCDHFVYIPQYGSTASLNVNVAAAIVLQHFAIWAGFSEVPHAQGKFA